MQKNSRKYLETKILKANEVAEGLSYDSIARARYIFCSVFFSKVKSCIGTHCCTHTYKKTKRDSKFKFFVPTRGIVRSYG